MKKVRWILIFVGLVVWVSVEGQVKIFGIVTDSLSGKPVPDVNIVVKGTTEGTSTDRDGQFSLTVRKLPVTLVATEIRHHTIEFFVERPQANIRLSPKIQMLGEVTIQGEKIQCIHPDEGVYAYDFEFYDEYILVLTFKKTKKESILYLLDDAGNTVKKEFLKHEPEGFYRDQLGFVHLLTADSAYQIYYDYNEIHLLYPTKKLSFLAMMYPIKARFHDKLILNIPSYRGLNSHFFTIGDKKKVQFYVISDSTKKSYLSREYDLEYFLQLRKMEVEGFQVSVKTLKENLDFYRQYVGVDWLDSKILEPVYAALYKIRDTLLIFDFIHSEAITFDDSLEVANKTLFSFHKERKWEKGLIVDETWQDIYTCYLKEGITQIARLDRKTFKPANTTEVDGMIFIDKLKIRNGHAYFLYKDYCRNTKRMIYKMVL